MSNFIVAVLEEYLDINYPLDLKSKTEPEPEPEPEPEAEPAPAPRPKRATSSKKGGGPKSS
ncbi:MAG: hypothetical protein SXA11_06590 [Cyanobacteriota bacterium]|nr:hypothetical protein [Cyanobacteriota bacterium]